MPQYNLPISQIAELLAVPEEDLRALMAKRSPSQGDTTLVGLTVAEAARRMGIGRTTLYKYVASGEIPSVKVGRLRRVPVEAVNAFLQRRLSSDGFGTAA